jgi:NitT/TauT family transport system permease protein
MEFFKVNAEPGKWARRLLPFGLIVVVILAYSVTAYFRHYGIPDSISEMGKELVFSLEKFDESDLSEQELFSVEMEAPGDVNISEHLREEFEYSEIPLSDDAAISEKTDATWLIADGDKTYVVREQDTELTVYRQLSIYEQLDSNTIPSKVQRGFEDGGNPLAEGAVLSTREKSSRWRIVDDASRKTYTVAREDGKLNIYEDRTSYFLSKRVGNPKDKLVPTLTELKDGVRRTAFEKDGKGDYRFWKDTFASTKRFLIGVAIVFLGVVVGLHMGTSPYLECMLYRFVLFFDKTPALALLPILIIVFGFGEVAKIALIAIGVMPTLILDTYLRARAVPREQITKAMTLKADNLEIIYRIVLPQIFPKVLDTIRLNFKAILLFLIAGEALASQGGLGYRIFLVRRYVAMDIIIPYVLWISLLAFLADLVVRVYIKKRYPWLNK